MRFNGRGSGAVCCPDQAKRIHEGERLGLVEVHPLYSKAAEG